MRPFGGVAAKGAWQLLLPSQREVWGGRSATADTRAVNSCSLPRWGRVGVGASGGSTGNGCRPPFQPSPKGGRAKHPRAFYDNLRALKPAALPPCAHRQAHRPASAAGPAASRAVRPRRAQSDPGWTATHSSAGAQPPTRRCGPTRTPAPDAPATSPCAPGASAANTPELRASCWGLATKWEERAWQAPRKRDIVIHLHLRSLLHVSCDASYSIA